MEAADADMGASWGDGAPVIGGDSDTGAEFSQGIGAEARHSSGTSVEQFQGPLDDGHRVARRPSPDGQ